MIKPVLYVVVGAFAGGVLFGSFFKPPQTVLFGLLVLATALGAVIFLIHAPPKVVRLFIFTAMAASFFVIGIFYINHAFAVDATKLLPEQIVSAKQTYIGVVADEPDYRETSTRLTVRLLEVSGQKINPERAPKVIVVTGRYSSLAYGDEIKFSGRLQKPENFVGDTGRTFDYIHYLSKDGIFYEISRPPITLLAHNQGSVIVGFLFHIKSAFLGKLKEFLPEPEASLAGGLTVGAKRALGTELLNDFRTTGVIHIVVLSGYNVSLVIDVLMGFLAFLPIALQTVFGLGAIVLFAIFVGAGATVIRAGTMAALVVVAKAFGRSTDALYLLIVAGALMVLFNPEILAFDTSFQLSFLATLGLILFSPWLSRIFHRVPAHWQLREIIVATIAAQVFVLPLLVYNVGAVSLVSLLVNVLVIITVPWAMLFGFLTGVLGFLPWLFAWPAAAIAQALLAYELWIVTLFARIPFASVVIPNLPAYIIPVTYLFYGLIAWLWHRRRRFNKTPVAL